MDVWDFPVTREKQEEVPGSSPEGRSPLHPGCQGRATPVAPVQWLLRVPLSPPACTRTGRKPKQTFELLCLPLQAVISHDGPARFYLQAAPCLLVLKDKGVFCSSWIKIKHLRHLWYNSSYGSCHIFHRVTQLITYWPLLSNLWVVHESISFFWTLFFGGFVGFFTFLSIILTNLSLMFVKNRLKTFSNQHLSCSYHI